MRLPTPDVLPVLVVEDDPQLLRTLADILEYHGHRTARASTGEEGLACVRRGSPAVALVDLRLPDMSGIDVIDGIHEISPPTQSIVLTGDGCLDSAVGALRHRAFDYLTKPVAPATLIETVQRAGERWQLRQAEIALRQSEARSKVLLETISDLVIAVDDTGTITYVSPSVAQILALSPENLIGCQWHDLVHPDDSRQATAHAVRVKHADGEWRLLEITTADFAGDTGRSGMLLTGRDVTVRERLTAQLHQARRMDCIGRMAGGVAHDFNNALTAILGFSEVLLDELGSNELVRGDLEAIQRAAEHGASISRQLLAFSSRQVLEPKVFDLGALVRDMAFILQRILGEHIELAVRAAHGRVRADPSQVEQVIMNLVVNARDAMPEGGTFSIEVEDVILDDVSDHPNWLPGPYVTLSAHDTGQGMTPDVCAQIFEPFFTTKESGQGTGLGLATVYGIVQQSGGHLDVHSEVGQGTTLTVYLPRAMDEVSRDAAGTPLATTRGCETILLVEDEVSLRRLLGRTLEQLGYEVVLAATGEEGLFFLQDTDRQLDLLVTDAILPGLSGPVLARQATSLRPGLHVLFVSGYSNDDTLRLGQLSPREAFLQKPFGTGTFVRKVQEVLGRRMCHVDVAL